MAARKTNGTDATATIDAAMTAGKETVEKVVKAGQDAMQMVDMDKAFDMAREQVATTQKTLFGDSHPMADVNLAVFDAYIASFTAATKGADALVKEVTAFTQKSVETSIENGKAIMACKTANEAFDKQNDIARANFDTLVAEGAKLTEMSIKATNDAVAPIQVQANDAFSKVFKATAA